MNTLNRNTSLLKRLWGKSLFSGLMRSHFSLVAMGSVSFLFALLALFVLEGRMKHALNHSVPLLENTLTAIEGVYAAGGAVNGVVALKKETYRREWEGAWNSVIDPAIGRLSRALVDDPLMEREEWSTLTASLRDLHEAQWWVFDTIGRHGEEPAAYLMERRVRPVTREIEQAVTLLLENVATWEKKQDQAVTIKQLADLRYRFTNSVTHLESLIATGFSPAQIEFYQNIQIVNDLLPQLQKGESSPELRSQFALIERLYPRYVTMAERLIEIRKSDAWSLTRAQVVKQVHPLERQVLGLLSELRLKAVEQAKTSTDEAMATANGVIALSAAIVVLLVIAGFVLSTSHARRIAAPVIALMTATRQFAQGQRVEDLPLEGYEETVELAGAFNAMRQVVELKEEELLRSEYRFRSLMENASDAIILADQEGRLLEVNAEAMRLLGRDRDEITQLSFRDLHPPDHVEFQKGRFASLWETGSVRVDEAWILRPDGVRSPVSISATLVDVGGEMIAQGIFRDMTEVRAAEAEADLFRRMVDQSREIILLVEPESGRILYGNEGAATNLGYHPMNFPSATVGDLVGTPDVPQWWGGAVEATRKGEGRAEETVMRRKDGSLFPVELSVQVSRTAGDDYALIMARDISERLRNAKLQEVAHSLEEANRELKDFNAVVSHDLQSPLTTIAGFSRRLMERLEGRLDDREADYLRRIDGAACRMSDLISALLEYSWAGGVSTKVVEIDLGDEIRGVLSDMAGSLEECGGTVEIGPLPKVYGDATLLRQAFQNLIGNAIKYRHEGRPPVVSVTHDPTCDQPHQVTIIVKDNGIGFDASQADRIFKVFERLHGDGEYQGTGIGLATTRKIVERHGGSISATAVVGEGATFFVTLTAAAS